MTIQSKTIKSLIAAAAVGAALTGMSANAQPRPYDNHAERQFNRNDQIGDRISNLRDRINDGQRMRRLSFREATRLSGKLNDIASLKRSYERSGRGLDNREVATLNARLDTLSGQVHYQGHDGNRG